VVIAIIGILLVIIVLAMGKDKMYAMEIVCKNNLHQYQIATELYLTDQKERFPSPWESLYLQVQFTDEAQGYCRWQNPVYNLDVYADRRDTATGKAYAGPYWPYLASTTASICPIFKGYALKYGGMHYSSCIGGPFDPQFSYSMNGMLQNGVKKSQIKSSPSQTFLWAEENKWRLQDKSGNRLSDHVLNDNALLVADVSSSNALIVLPVFTKSLKRNYQFSSPRIRAEPADIIQVPPRFFSWTDR
jgi:type II secretory pathway pseudopilin PulG